jgi:RND superfamily putative drug exporter
MTAALTALATRRPRRVLLVTVLAAVAAGVYGGPVAGLLDSGRANFQDPASQSVRADRAIETETGIQASPGIVALVKTPAGVAAPSSRRELASVAATFARDPAVGHVATAFAGGGPALVARDHRSTYVAVWLRPASDSSQNSTADRLASALSADRNVALGGPVIANKQVSSQVSADLARAELLVFPLLFLLSLWVFRGVVAALLPPLMGGITIVCTFVGLRAVNGVWPLSVFAVNLVTGLGLGLAIDYSLFIVSRYREELGHHGHGREALARTMATAGRTVLFSSLTVAAAMAALLVFPQRFLYSMGVGGAICALLAVAIALLALPALLHLLGPRVNALAPRRWAAQTARAGDPVTSGVWYRLSRLVMRRPAVIATVVTALLLLLGSSALRVHFAPVDPSVLPSTASARQVDDALRADFASNRSTPVFVAVRAPASARAALARYAAGLARVPGIAQVGAPRLVAPGAWRIDSFTRADPSARVSQDAIRAMRAVPAPFPRLIGGQTAQFVDQQASLASHLPLALIVVALATLLILFAMTGSVVLPLKALLMNILTLGATFGLLVLIFQEGHLEGLLSFHSSGALDATQPIVLCAIAFGLSTDYGVFLLGRIKEAHDSGAGETESVAIGLERTGRLVTSAALLFCVAIGAFATSQIVFIKELGLGTAFAVALDATLVRALLVPSLMALLGRRNWWAPAPLRRLHAWIGLRDGASGSGEPAAQPARVTA